MRMHLPKEEKSMILQKISAMGLCLKAKLLHLGVLAFARIMWAVPFSLRQRIIFSILWLDLIRPGGKKGKITRNISTINPGLSEKEISKYRRHFLFVLAKSWASLFEQKQLSREEVLSRIVLEGAEPLVRHHRAGRKIVLAVVHVGPIDEFFWIISFLGLRLYVPVEPIKPSWRLELMKHARTAKAPETILEPIEKGKTLIRAAKHLAAGRIVVLFIDVTQRVNGVACRIGAGQAKFPVGAVKLALSQNALLIPVFTCLEQDGRTKITISRPLRLTKTGDIDRDVEYNTRILVEKVYGPHILKYLSQWLRLPWAHIEPARYHE